MEQQRILELPLNGRNVGDLVAMIGAAVAVPEAPHPPEACRARRHSPLLVDCRAV